MIHKELMNEYYMLKGNINRMMVTKDPKELREMFVFAGMRLLRIYEARATKLDEAEEDDGTKM